MAGRLTLIKNVLCSIPLHILSVLKVPVHIIHDIDRLLRDFLWGYVDNRKKFHWVRWDICTRPLHDLGLGIRRFADMQYLFRIKAC